ncbi:MAG: hypothetical protein H6642_03915 [Caldilineaceae bacterium]|nr:hypothetical protein [Caldilineaceae bacterium]
MASKKGATGSGFMVTPGPPAISSGHGRPSHWRDAARSAASGGMPAWRSISTTLK